MPHTHISRLIAIVLLLGIGTSCATQPIAPPLASPPAFQAGDAHVSTILPIHAFQQTTDYTCGPACIVTLLRYYGRDGDEMQIAKEMGTNADTGTTPQQMANWLKSHGFRVTWGENGSLDMLRANLARHVPTIVEWIDWGGHWDVVAGYDTRKTDTPDDDLIIFADPSDCTDGTVDGVSTFNAERFDSMWFDAFLFGRPMKKIYICAEPETQPATRSQH